MKFIFTSLFSSQKKLNLSELKGVGDDQRALERLSNWRRSRSRRECDDLYIHNAGCRSFRRGYARKTRVLDLDPLVDRRNR